MSFPTALKVKNLDFILAYRTLFDLDLVYFLNYIPPPPPTFNLSSLFILQASEAYASLRASAIGLSDLCIFVYFLSFRSLHNCHLFRSSWTTLSKVALRECIVPQFNFLFGPLLYFHPFPFCSSHPTRIKFSAIGDFFDHRYISRLQCVIMDRH